MAVCSWPNSAKQKMRVKADSIIKGSKLANRVSDIVNSILVS